MVLSLASESLGATKPISQPRMQGGQVVAYSGSLGYSLTICQRTNAPRHQYSRLISAGGNDPRVFYHDYHRALRSPRAVHHTFGNDEALPRVESYQPPFEIDQKLTLNNVKNSSSSSCLCPWYSTQKTPNR